eukprot:UN03458
MKIQFKFISGRVLMKLFSSTSKLFYKHPNDDFDHIRYI